MRPIPKPNAVVLARSPEMAIVELLDSALELTTNALFAANPELESSEFLLELPQPSVQACLADAILTHAIAFSQFFNDPFFNNPFFNNSVQDVKINIAQFY